MSEKLNITFISKSEDKKKKERRGLRKMGGESSPISPPLDPRLVRYINDLLKLYDRNCFMSNNS